MPRQIKTPGEQPAAQQPVVPDPDQQPSATDVAGADPQPVAPAPAPAPAPVPAAPQPAVQKRPVLTPDGWVV